MCVANQSPCKLYMFNTKISLFAYHRIHSHMIRSLLTQTLLMIRSIYEHLLASLPIHYKNRRFYRKSTYKFDCVEEFVLDKLSAIMKLATFSGR